MCYSAAWLLSGGRYMLGCLPIFLLGARPKVPGWRTAAPVLSGLLLCCYSILYMDIAFIV